MFSGSWHISHKLWSWAGKDLSADQHLADLATEYHWPPKPQSLLVMKSTEPPSGVNASTAKHSLHSIRTYTNLHCQKNIITSRHHTSPYQYLTISISIHAIPSHPMPCHAMPCHAMPCHAMPHHTMSYFIRLQYISLHVVYIEPCNVVLAPYYTILAMTPYYTTLQDLTRLDCIALL